MSIEFTGLDSILDRLDKAADITEMEQALNRCCLIVERAAKMNAPKGGDMGGSLAQSIASRVDKTGETISGVVYSPLEYAPYVEYGTGKFAEKGSGSSGYWVYVRNSYKSGVRSSKRYSLEDAKRIVAMMREEGLDAVYTDGMQPQPYMRPALNQNRQKILETLKGALKVD